MRYPVLSLLTLSLLFWLSVLPAPGQNVEPYTELNSPADDYAVTMRALDNQIELWVTTAEGMPFRSRHLARASGKGGTSLGSRSPVDAPVNRVQRSSEGGVQLDGCATFSLCDPSYGIFASNRPVNGRDFDNDLYAMSLVGGEWNVERLSNLCSEGWDDTPALSPDGQWLYFASDRRNPGSGKTDIYVSHRTANGWSTPTLLEGINTEEASEQTPFPGIDGRLYYSTNALGDYDIHVVPLDSRTGQPVAQSTPLALEGVNRRGSDEGHPFLGPGGDWLIFSSNRGGGDLDVYRTTVPKVNGQVLRIRVMARELEDDGSGRFHDVTRPVSVKVNITDQMTGTQRTGETGTDGEYLLAIPSGTSGPAATRSLIVSVDPNRNGDTTYIPTTDTLSFSTTCSDTLTHTLYLWNTTVYFSPKCEQDFPVSNVQFFITGYWCPTTRKYVRHTPCRSVFDDDLYTSVEGCPETMLTVTEDELYRYTLHQPRIEKERQEGICIRWDEMRQRREEFAVKVDSAVALFTDNMRSAFKPLCVDQALKRGDTIRVYVTGWTDPRDIHPLCQYTGDEIDFDTSPIRLHKIDGTFATGRLPHGIGFREYDKSLGVDRQTQGNQLLSELRAWYTALLLDRVWNEEITEYRKYRLNGQIEVIAVGRAINQSDLSFEQRRSVNVRIEAPVSQLSMTTAMSPGQRKTGGKVRLCGGICGE